MFHNTLGYKLTIDNYGQVDSAIARLLATLMELETPLKQGFLAVVGAASITVPIKHFAQFTGLLLLYSNIVLRVSAPWNPSLGLTSYSGAIFRY